MSGATCVNRFDRAVSRNFGCVLQAKAIVQFLKVKLSLYLIRHSSLEDIIQSDTKKRELLKNPTKIEEIQEKNLLTEIALQNATLSHSAEHATHTQ